jgi:hypothetical protein
MQILDSTFVIPRQKIGLWNGVMTWRSPGRAAVAPILFLLGVRSSRKMRVWKLETHKRFERQPAAPARKLAIIMNSQAMKREDGGSVSAALAHHVAPLPVFHMRQTSRGWWQECLGCEARTEFKYYKGPPELESLADVNDPRQLTHIATSLDESTCLCRWCFPSVYGKSFKKVERTHLVRRTHGLPVVASFFSVSLQHTVRK